MTERDNKQYSVQLEPEIIAKIDYYAKEYGLTRSKLMRNLIITGLDDMNILHKAGVLKMIQFKDKVVMTIQNLINDKKLYVGKNGNLKVKE